MLEMFIRYTNICVALRDLLPFAQYKKHEKHPWRSATFNVTLNILNFYVIPNTLSLSIYSQFSSNIIFC